MNRNLMPAYMMGQPDAQWGFTVDVDTAGSVLAGEKVPLDAPVGVRLPPVNKGPKGHKSKIVSHVHVHRHLHYHVNRPAAESDLRGSALTPGPGVPGAS